MSPAGEPVIIVGGGHNGLVAATYLARAGRRVTVLEARATLGGAVASAAIFPGVEARLSRFSYLVSLLPDLIIDDLGLRARAAVPAGEVLHPVRRIGPAGRAAGGSAYS